jgi:murein DD-endopeptidase MepM/ murein hydrolase activator NlpD
VVVAVVVAVLASIASGAVGEAGAACWRPPVDAPIADPFREPTCRWCPGNRGLEYDTRDGQPVRAVAAGRVVFAGLVARVRYVVVRHGDGRRATYGRLVDATVRSGDLVVAGTVVGRAGASFHFGLRVGDEYVDPAPHLGELVRRARLVPVDGTPGNAGRPATLRCPAGVGTRRRRR